MRSWNVSVCWWTNLVYFFPHGRDILNPFSFPCLPIMAFQINAPRNQVRKKGEKKKIFFFGEEVHTLPTERASYQAEPLS
jgi:hypothetical protein